MYIALPMLLGTCPIVWLKDLPTRNYTIWFVPILIVSVFVLKQKPLQNILIFLTVIIVSYNLSLHFCSNILRWSLDETIEDKPVLVVGRIKSLVQGGRFIFDVSSIDNNTVKTVLLLNWYRDNNKIKPDEKWQLLVKLRRPHESLNAGGLDKEKWYFIKGIRAKGVIIKSQYNKKLQEQRVKLISLRNHFSEIVNKLQLHQFHMGIIPALVIGDQTKLTNQEKEVFRKTGTAHLMAISGLHVGLIASFFYCLTHLMFRFYPWIYLQIPKQKIASLLAFSGAFFYSGLAGFSYSTERALIMLACILLQHWLSWKPSYLDSVSMALVIILLLSPVAILDTGFWLSFSAVATLGYALVYQENRSSLWWKWGRAQWACSVGLLPITAWYFKQISLMSFFANLIAIPFVSFITVPISFIGILVCLINFPVGKIILSLNLELFNFLFKLLSFMSNLTYSSYTISVPNLYILFLSMIASILILTSRTISLKLLGCLFMFPLFIYQLPSPKFGDAKITQLDVGQGLATIIQTAKHTLVYDTGPHYGKYADAGAMVALPYLKYNRIKKIDKLIVSHGDSDHMGGAMSILKEFPGTPLLTSATHKFKNFNPILCHVGQSWVWDGVRFEILYPEKNAPYKANASSCVVKVSTKKYSALFTGDIPKKVEKQLIVSNSAKLQSNILIVPHHGSKTSSSLEFIQQVKPSVALFSYGYRNRYRHPASSVIDRYLSLGITNENSVDSGEIDVYLSDRIAVQSYRKQNKHIWSQ